MLYFRFMAIEIVRGDATNPTGEGKKIIAHIANDIGKMGAGFVLPLIKKYPKVREQYLSLFESEESLILGSVQFVPVEADVHVANMIAQRGIGFMKDGSPAGCPPIRYDALLKCLRRVGEKAKELNAVVHGPKFGAGLSGGNWEIISMLIEKVLVEEYGRKVVIWEP